MATATITSAQRGAYEIPLTAGTEATIDVATQNTMGYGRIEVIAHTDLTSPVYALLNATVTAKSPTASIVLAGSSIVLDAGYDIGSGTNTVHIISSQSGTVSIARA